MKRAVTKFISQRQGFLGASAGDAAEGHRLDVNSVDDFYILLDDPHRSWSPGDELSGQIIFISKKNLANISITLSLVGYVKINPSSHSKLRLVKRSLFNHTIRIYGLDDPVTPTHEYSNGLYKGEHRFPFIVKLPNKRIFTSVDFGKGRIVYLLRAMAGEAGPTNTTSLASVSLSSPSESGSSPGAPFSRQKSFRLLQNSNFTSEKILNIVAPIDVSTLPPAQPKRLKIRDPRRTKMLARTQSSTSTINTYNTYNTVSSNNSDTHTNGDLPSSQGVPGPAASPGELADPESIRLSLDVSQRGFLRGELIPIKIQINHLKKVQDVNGIIITFVRVCRIENGPDGLFDSFRKDLQQQVVPLYVDPVTFASEISTSVRVPADAFPTITGCPLVSFQYFLEVLVNLSGKSILLDNNDHPKQSVQINEAPSHSLMETEAKQANFRFNFSVPSANAVSQKERSGFLNTDKYKRMKKFLQLTTEVVIGTHRLGSVASTPEAHVEPMSTSRHSLLPVSNTSEHGYTLSDPSPSNSMVPNSVEVDDTSPQAMVIPPYSDNQPSFLAPNYLDIVGTSHDLLPMPTTNGHSEKDRMRIHEESLLPSEPILDDIDEDDKETIEPHIQGGSFTEHEINTDLHARFNDDNNAPVQPAATEDDDSLYHIPSRSLDSAPRYDRASQDTLLQEAEGGSDR